MVGRPRQNVNYHLKELERAGLVRRVGRRRNGNFTETLYESVAGTFLVSPRAVWGDPRRIKAMADQHSLENLLLLGGSSSTTGTSCAGRPSSFSYPNEVGRPDLNHLPFRGDHS